MAPFRHGLSSCLAAATILAATLVAVIPMSPAADDDQAQSICVADLNSHTHVNGYPCRNPRRATGEDFVYRKVRDPGDTTHSYFGSHIQNVFAMEWPALNTMDMAWARIDFAPNGLHIPHWHPRANELLHCEEGTLLIGFVDESTNRLFSSIVEVGDLHVFPRGVIHFQLNVGPGPARAQTAYNSQNPALAEVGPSTFGSHPTIGDNVLRKAFDLSEESVLHLKKFFSDEQMETVFGVLSEHFGSSDSSFDSMWNSSFPRSVT
ncbi:hypothetical protein KC19_10G062500 [Ceratodon purpureus]|uniref:Germin-like protein n=1 Tax=Ceratodon purpureus TaxID=3225 RepID=A0A8T0GIR9_CERPU|nr:hypothetical protein KC19_10G062500 [Ceratodon purpureus]